MFSKTSLNIFAELISSPHITIPYNAPDSEQIKANLDLAKKELIEAINAQSVGPMTEDAPEPTTGQTEPTTEPADGNTNPV